MGGAKGISGDLEALSGILLGKLSSGTGEGGVGGRTF